MKILALDTTTEACSAALQLNDDISETCEVAPRRHADLILSMIDGLLKESDTSLKQLDCIAFTHGPGAFTGVRLCTSIAQGLAFAAEIPVIGISTLATIAQGYRGDVTTILSAIDARMGEIYWGLYSRESSSTVRPVSEENVCKPEELHLDLDSDIYGCGTGWGTYQEILAMKTAPYLAGSNPEQLPSAKDVLPMAVEKLKLGKVCTAKQALPVYLRNKVTN